MGTYLERLWREVSSCGVDRMVFDLTLAPIVLEMELRDDALQSRLAAAEGLLRECRDSVERDYLGCDEGLQEPFRQDRLARIDAHLAAHPAPKPNKEAPDGR